MNIDMSPRRSCSGFALAFLGVLATACGTPQRTTEARPPVAEAAGREISFRFLGTFPLALVDVTIGGKSTLAILDTGAEAHVITAAFAKANGLVPVASSQKTYDSGGRAMSVDVVEHPEINIAGWGPVPDRPAMVLDMPEMFQRLTIGCILSPQHMATPSQSIVIDFPKKTLRSAPAPDAAREATAGGSMYFKSARTCRDPSAHT
ncbi:MAG TPA: retropepsin-like aspartic protease, partial [Polyangiaceae bacterium]|nr:retropepsin-like aspartic protease [Polyangiaceae bacterium]